MLGVVEGHDLLGDVRLEGIVVVGQRRESVGHGGGNEERWLSNDGRSSIYLLIVTSRTTFPQFNNALERRAGLNARIGDSLRRFGVCGGLYCIQIER